MEVETNLKLEIKPGVYDLSIDDYHESEGISRSGIMHFKRSPLHYWHHHINEDKEPENDTDALIFGNAVHTFILEPEKYEHTFLVVPKVDRRTSEGKAKYARLTANLGDKKIITEELHEQVIKISESINKHPFAKDLISNAQYEKSIYWNDPETGILCKCRPDIWRNNSVCDLKTTNDASQSAFQRSIYGYGYHIQAAMIREGLLQACNQKIEEFVFIAVEKEPPFAVGVYLLSKEAIDKGYEEFKEILKHYKLCLENNNWPSYEITQVSLPAFYLNQ